ncbi:MAG: glycosyltransferase family 2 protein [Pseudomonadota bacterium]
MTILPPELSIIVPMYNESEALTPFFESVIPVLEATLESFEIICINDGSLDDTYVKLFQHHRTDPRIKIVDLSRNFGKEAAITAGIDLAMGRAVLPMDADLQDPPELIPKMVEAWRNGGQIVLARRIDRSSDGLAKRITARWFYKVFSGLANRPIPPDVGDYRLMDRIAVDALKRLPERSRFMKGLFSWVGYNQVTIDFVRPKRQTGKTSFNYWKLWNFALDGLVSFSALPLKIWSYFGVLVSLGALAYLIYILIITLALGVDVPGYASTLSVILFFNGILLISLGVQGEYIARIFAEVKQRPLYLINDLVGFQSLPSQTGETGAAPALEPYRIVHSVGER